MTKHPTFAILLGGDLTATPKVGKLAADARIIAADGGMKHAHMLDVEPELWVGDFDSATDHALEHYAHIEKQNFDRSKDQTDGSLAIEAAIQRGAKSIVLLGAIGGERTDHMLSLMFEMVATHEKGFEIFATSGEEECWPLQNSEIELALPEGSTFSILPLSDLKGLFIEGAQYPLQDCDVAFGSSFTMSNISLGQTHIGVQSGRCLVLTRPFDFSGT